MHVLVLTDQIDIDSDFIYNLDVNLLETISKASLVDPLLHRVKIESQSLVLSSDGTPKIKKFTKRILLKSSK